MKKIVLTILVLFAMILSLCFISCGKTENTDTATDTEKDTVTDTEKESDTEKDTVTDTEKESDTEKDTVTDTEKESDTEKEHTEHNFVPNGANKKCTVCKKEFEYTEEENFNDWMSGIKDSKNDKYRYSYSKTTDNIDASNGEVLARTSVFESRDWNKFLIRNETFFVPKGGTSLQKMFANLTVIKTVDVEGTERIKLYREQFTDGTISKNGTYKKPDFSVDTLAGNSPSSFIELMCIGNGETFAELCEILREAYNFSGEDYSYSISDIELKRNDDNTVSLIFMEEGEYIDGWSSGNAGYKKTVYTRNYEITASTDEIKKCVTDVVDTAIYENEVDNVATKEKSIETFSHYFDEETYNSISVETDTTDDEYTATISFVINGYYYGYSHYDIKIGSNYTLSDAQNFLADMGEGLSKPMFTHDVDPKMFDIYIDKEKTQKFSSIEIDSERYTLYVDMVVPDNKAIIIVAYEYKSGAQGIHLCYIKDIGATFDPSAYMDTYPAIEVDGVEVTDDNVPTISISESRIYTVVYKVQ